MKLYSVLDSGFYAGLKTMSDEEASITECTSLQPTGLLIDASHCPRLLRTKKDIQWVDDSSEEARAMSEKYHKHISPFS